MAEEQKRKFSVILGELHPVYKESVREFAEMCCVLQKLKLKELARSDKKDTLYKPTFAIDCFRGVFDVDPQELRRLKSLAD